MRPSILLAKISMIYLIVFIATCARGSRPIHEYVTLDEGPPEADATATIASTTQPPPATSCPKTSPRATVRWAYVLQKQDLVESCGDQCKIELEHTFVLLCGNKNIGLVDVAPRLDPIHPVNGSSIDVAINDLKARDAWTRKLSCPEASVRFMHSNGTIGACIATITKPGTKRYHIRSLFYLLPAVGTYISAASESLDEREPWTQDALELLMVAFCMASSVLFLYCCRDAVVDARADPLEIRAPSGVKVPSFDNIARETLIDCGKYLADVFTYIFPIFLIMRMLGSNGQTALIVLMAPPFVASVAVLRILKTGFRRQAFYGGLCQGVWVRHDVQRFDRSVIYVQVCTVVIVLVVVHSIFRAYLEESMMMNEIIPALAGFAIPSCKSIITFRTVVGKQKETAECKLDLNHFTIGDEGSSAQVSIDFSMRLELLQEPSFIERGRQGVADPLKMQAHVEGGDDDGTGIFDVWSFRDITWLTKLVSRWIPIEAALGRKQVKLIPNVVLLLICGQAILSLAFSMGYAAFIPKLVRFETTAGHTVPDFEPKVYDYSVLMNLDHDSFTFFAEANPKEAAAMSVSFGTSDSNTIQDNTVVNRTTAGITYPVVVNVSLFAGLWDNYYSMRMRPIELFVKSLVLRGDVGDGPDKVNFVRCVPWGVIPGTEISLPSGVSNLFIELATEEYELGLPIAPGDARPRESFFAIFQHGIPPSECKVECQHDPGCLVSKAAPVGCYQIHGPQNCMESHAQARRATKVANTSLGRFLRSRSLNASLCFPSVTGKFGVDCHSLAPPTSSDDITRLRLTNATQYIEWLNDEANGLVQISLIDVEHDALLSSFNTALQFRLGTPLVSQILCYVKPGNITTKVTVTSSPSIVVELMEYDPRTLSNLEVFLVPLIMDPDFYLVEQSEHVLFPKFKECDEDPGLSRFKVCGGLRESSIILRTLNPWTPFENFKFTVSPREGLLGFQPLSIPVTITTLNQSEPLQWLIRHDCTHLPNTSQLYTESVVGDLAAFCNTQKSAEIVADFLSKGSRTGHAGTVLLRLGENLAFEDMFKRISKVGIPDLTAMTTFEILAFRNASQPLMTRYCDLMGVKDFLFELSDAFKNGIDMAQVTECVAQKGVETLLNEAVVCFCPGCIQAVEGAMRHSKALQADADKIKNFTMDHDFIFACGAADMDNTIRMFASANQQKRSPKPLTLFLQLLNGLQNISMHSNNYMGMLESDGRKELWNTITSMPELRVLTIPGLEDTALEDFFSSLSKNAGSHKLPKLKHLQITKNHLKSRPTEFLGEALERLGELTYLGFENTDIDPKSAEILARPLADLTHLTHLHLLADTMGTQGFDAIASSLTNLTALEDIELKSESKTGCKIGMVGAQALATSFSRMPRLRRISLFGIGLNSSGFNLLAPVLTSKSTLEDVNLEYNDIGSEAGEQLAHIMSNNPRIWNLALTSNRLGAAGGNSLVPGLKDLGSLTDFTIRRNQIGTEVMEAIVEALIELRQRNQTFEYVDGSQNDVSAEIKSAAKQLLKSVGVEYMDF